MMFMYKKQNARKLNRNICAAEMLLFCISFLISLNNEIAITMAPNKPKNVSIGAFDIDLIIFVTMSRI